MNIREVRKALKMSKTEFGEALGVNYITVLNWEKGIEPRKKNIDAIRELAMQNGLTFEPRQSTKGTIRPYVPPKREKIRIDAWPYRRT